MNNNIILSKASVSYLRNKKALYFFTGFITIISALASLPLFLSKEVGSYSWIFLSTSTICLSALVLYIFNILFVDSKYNQLDLILLSKAKKTKNLFISKWITTLLIINIFIIMNSFLLSLVFSIYSYNFIWFVPTLLSSILVQNLFATLLILLFSFILLYIKGRIAPLIVSLSTMVVIFSSSIGIKIASDIQDNKISFASKSNFTHEYENLYVEENGKIKKTIIERTNYAGTLNNDSLNSSKFNWSNINFLDLINGLQSMTISKQLSNSDVIIGNNFNINSNHFTVKSNFWNDKKHLKIKEVYPIGVKPLFELNHFQIQEHFKNVYQKLTKKGYSKIEFASLKTFIINNDFWESVGSSLKELLYNSIGIIGDQNLLYFLRDKEILLQKAPDLFNWMSKELSPEFSNMMKEIYSKPKSRFNIKNIKEKNRNELLSIKTLNEEEQASNEDIDFFKDVIKFSGNNIEVNGKVKSTISLLKAEMQKEGIKDNISNKKEWTTFIEKQSFHLKDLEVVKKTLENIDKSLNNYEFKTNDFNITEFHYQYTNQTTTPIITTTISLFIILSTIALLFFMNIQKLKTANLKGF
ncbi:MAG: hypothetical protein GY679_02230 [Mycoplasma sp.]|nr:hypothetical protein [Mycoplasma sp.]